MYFWKIFKLLWSLQQLNDLDDSNSVLEGLTRSFKINVVSLNIFIENNVSVRLEIEFLKVYFKLVPHLFVKIYGVLTLIRIIFLH